VSSLHVDLPAGPAFGRDDLMFARPANEFPSGEVTSLVGKRVTQAYRMGETIRRADVDMS